MKYLMVSGVMIILAGSLTGCNTIQGFGEDVSEGGGVITDSSEKVEQDIKKN